MLRGLKKAKSIAIKFPVRKREKKDRTETEPKKKKPEKKPKKKNRKKNRKKTPEIELIDIKTWGISEPFLR